MKSNKILKFSGIAIYSILLILISLYVFVANDESQPLIEILQLDYLLPALIYSSGTLVLCYFIYKLLSKWLIQIISFTISLLVGIPLGILLIEQIFILIKKINML